MVQLGRDLSSENCNADHPIQSYAALIHAEHWICRQAITSISHTDVRCITQGANVDIDWPHIWQTSDIVIDGDPEAQQVTHANLFYLLSSTFPGSTYSIPPMGLSSNVYGGHIFWDADVWMLPALIVQHPEYAKPIVDYRFKLLAQAKKNAKAHGYAGAEYPWESADTGKEEAPGEFAQERHITADVAFAAWQWYLWTGDNAYLKREGWPLLQATAQYWVSRVTKGTDGKYHIKGVLSPDETAGLVDDDAYTNAVVRYNLQAATRAAAAGRADRRPALDGHCRRAVPSLRQGPRHSRREQQADDRPICGQAGRHAAAPAPARRLLRRRQPRSGCWTSTRPTPSRPARP